MSINIRIDEKTKKQASKTLEAMGMDMSTAIKIFLRQVIVDQCIPFRPSKIGGLTRAQMDKEVEYALKHGKGYTDIDEMFRDILK